MKAEQNKITNLQRELVKVFSYEVSEEELKDIRDLLSNYFAEKATREMDRLWDERGWTNETMDKWLKEHKRTSIRSRFSFEEARELLKDYKGSFSDAVIEERRED